MRDSPTRFRILYFWLAQFWGEGHLTTVLAVGLALRQGAMAIAILGIIGAFATPITLGAFHDLPTEGGMNPDVVLAYILLLDLGILGLAAFRNWPWLNLLGLLGSVVLFSLWHAEYGEDASLFLAQISLTGIFLIFVGTTSLLHILWRWEVKPADLVLVVATAGAYFLLSYDLLWDDHSNYLGGFSLLLAVFYGIIGYIAFVRSRDNPELGRFAVAIAIVFLTIFVPLQFDGPWITVAWAAEGAALMWIWPILGLAEIQIWSVVVLAAMVIRLCTYDALQGGYDRTPVLNYEFLAFAVNIVAIYAAAYVCYRNRASTAQEADPILPSLIVAANLLSLWILSAELAAYFDSENATNLSLTVLWTLYALVLIVLGIAGKWRYVRVGGLALFLVAIIKVFAFDMFTLGGGYRVAAFASLGIILIAGGFLYQRYDSIIKRFILE